MHILEIVEVRYGDTSLPKHQVVEAMTVDIKKAHQLVGIIMEDNEDAALEIIQARGTASGDMAFRAKDGEAPE